MSCGVGCRHCLNLALLWLWLWCRPVATAPIWSLVWEPPYAASVALKRHTHTHTHTQIVCWINEWTSSLDIRTQECPDRVKCPEWWITEQAIQDCLSVGTGAYLDPPQYEAIPCNSFMSSMSDFQISISKRWSRFIKRSHKNIWAAFNIIFVHRGCSLGPLIF